MDPNAYNPNPQNAGPQPPYGQNGQNSQGGQQYPQQPYGQPSYPPAQPQQSGYQPLQPLQPNPYSGYNPNPYPGETGESKKSGKPPSKMIFAVIAAIAIVAVLGAVGVAMLGDKSPAATQTDTTKTAKEDVGADIVPRSDGRLDLSATVDATSSVKEQTIKAKTKEQINLSSGFSFMATKLEPFTPGDAAVKPASGKQFVVVSAAVGNRAQTNALSVSYLDFKLRDNDNNLLPGHASTQAILGNTLANPTSIKPGEQITGKIVFEVDATDTSWVLVHKETYQKTTDNTTFTVEGEEVVALPSATATPPATPPAATP